MVNYATPTKTTDPEYPMNTNKDAQSVTTDRMAERVGFEPTVGFPTSVFKTDAIDHSATSPCLLVRSYLLELAGPGN